MLLARSLLFSLVRSPGVGFGRSCGLAPDGWQAALSVPGWTIAIHYRCFELTR